MPLSPVQFSGASSHVVENHQISRVLMAVLPALNNDLV
jgi:hypothetical protein